MSASIILNLPYKFNLYRSIRNFSYVLSSKCFSTYSPIRLQYIEKNHLKFLVPIASCKFCTKPKNNPDVTKNVISEVKIGETQSKNVAESSSESKEEKLGLFARFKLMYRQYWYVLIPVHVITSIGWFGGFYYLSKSGVDVPSLLQSLHFSDVIIDKVKGSMGHVAIAYLLYKIATPARYAVTLGGTTFVIEYLSQAGYIKPMPSKSELIKMYEDKKADRVKKKQDRLQKERDEK